MKNTNKRLIKIANIKSLLVENGGTFFYRYFYTLGLGWPNIKKMLDLKQWFTLKIDPTTQNLGIVKLGEDEMEPFSTKSFSDDYLDEISIKLKKEIYEKHKWAIMKRWEYMSCYAEQLNDLGKEGWEAYATTDNIFRLKREIKDN